MVRSWSTRSSLLCRPWPMSPISSRKIVPPFASSNSPRLDVLAPVKAPLTCPKSSLSSSPSGIAEQLIGMKGFSVARSVVVERSRDHLLARTALARDEHAAATVRNLPDQREDVAHGGARADQIAEGRGLIDRPPQPLVLLLERAPLEGPLHRDERRLVLEGLGDVVERAGAHGVDGGVDAAKGRHQDDGGARTQIPQLAHHFDAGLAGHADVAEHGVEIEIPHLLDGVVRRRRLRRPRSPAPRTSETSICRIAASSSTTSRFLAVRS